MVLVPSAFWKTDVVAVRAETTSREAARLFARAVVPRVLRPAGGEVFLPSTTARALFESCAGPRPLGPAAAPSSPLPGLCLAALAPPTLSVLPAPTVWRSPAALPLICLGDKSAGVCCSWSVVKAFASWVARVQTTASAVRSVSKRLAPRCVPCCEHTRAASRRIPKRNPRTRRANADSNERLTPDPHKKPTRSRPPERGHAGRFLQVPLSKCRPLSKQPHRRSVHDR